MKKTSLLFLSSLFFVMLFAGGCSKLSPDRDLSSGIKEATGSTNTSDIIEVSLTGDIDQTTQSNTLFEKDKFFILPQQYQSSIKKFDIFDKNNLNKPLYTITLPQTEQGGYKARGDKKPLFFNTPEIYLIAYLEYSNEYSEKFNVSNNNPDYILFKVSFTGQVTPLLSLGTGSRIMSNTIRVIDTANKKIIWRGDFVNNSLTGITIFDIDKNKSSIFSYSPPKENIVISKILSYNNNIVTFIADLNEIDEISEYAVVVEADASSQKVLSTIPYSQYKDTEVIKYKDCDFGGECSLFSVNGGLILQYTGDIFFTDIILDNTILVGWKNTRSDSPMYRFIPLNEIKKQ